MSYLVSNSFLHPLICYSLLWVTHERGNDLVKISVFLTRLRAERETEREKGEIREPYLATFPQESLAVCVSDRPAALKHISHARSLSAI